MEGSRVEYLLLTLSSWASDAEGWFESLSGWHFLVAGGAMLLVLALAIR
jgi:hypothetical protein